MKLSVVLQKRRLLFRYLVRGRSPSERLHRAESLSPAWLPRLQASHVDGGRPTAKWIRIVLSLVQTHSRTIYRTSPAALPVCVSTASHTSLESVLARQSQTLGLSR